MSEAEWDEGELGEPSARVAQVGRWTYSIRIIHGLMEINPSYRAWGRNRAQRKAHHKLERYKTRRLLRSNTWEVR